jgi:hypothetical protein
MSRALAVIAKHFPKDRTNPRYFYVLFAKISKNDVDPDWMGWHDAAYKFEKIAFEQKAAVYNRKSDLDALEILSKTISKLEYLVNGEAMSDAASRRLNLSVRFGAHADDMPCEDNEELCEYLMSNGITDHSIPCGVDGLFEYMSDHGNPQVDAIRVFLDYAPDIKKAIDQTKAAIETSPRTRKAPSLINLAGVQCVEAARIVWEEYTGQTPPYSDLNPASTFGKFLADLFEAYEIKGQPKSAFRAWARLASPPG